MGQDAALAQKVDAQQADIVKLRQELVGDVEGLRSDIQKLKKTAREARDIREPGTPKAKELPGTPSGETPEFGRSWPGGLSHRPPVPDRPPRLEHDLSRGRLRPRPSSSSAARRLDRADTISLCSESDGPSSECLQGLVGAMGAMARIIGLFKDGTEKLGEGEWEWAKVAHRFEQAWAD